MKFIVEEVDIRDEQSICDHDLDVDLNHVPQYPDWKLNPNVECRVVVKRLKSLHTQNEVLRDGDEAQIDSSSPQNCRAVSSCGVYRKLKLLVDVLKNCEKSECELCEKYIQQLQQHLLLTHGKNREEAPEMNSIETAVSVSAPIVDGSGVPFEMEDVNIPHDDDVEKSEDELVPALTIKSMNDGELCFHRKDRSKIKRKSISKRGKSKPFKCETCGKDFLTFYELTQHTTIHMEENRDILNVRGNSVRTPSSNQQGLSTGYRKQKFKCDVCRKGFSRSTYLSIHKRIHTGEKPFKCDTCGKCFAQTCTLIDHKYIHTGKKPYRCDLCGKLFIRPTTLTKHKLTHSGENPSQCVLFLERASTNV